jgi:hypothetical protein
MPLALETWVLGREALVPGHHTGEAQDHVQAQREDRRQHRTVDVTEHPRQPLLPVHKPGIARFAPNAWNQAVEDALVDPDNFATWPAPETAA